MIKIILFKELKIFFRSPVSYIVTGLFTLIVGWIFFNQLVYFAENIQKLPISMRNTYDFSNEVVIKLFGNVNFLLLFIIPIISMRSFSQEYKDGTIDLYFSSPVADYELILGKFLALTVQGLFLISTTLIYPLFLSNLDISDTSFIVSGYIGLILNLLSFCSLGILASSLSQNQIIAALSGFVMILFSWMVTMFEQMTHNYFMSEILKFLSINHHFQNFVKGYISLSDISFYFSFILLSLVVLKKRIDSRLWG